MSELLMCTKEAIQAAPNACAFVREACEDQYEYINFLSFYYCDLNENVPGIVLIAILFVLFIFNLLGTTADKFLAPSLEVITQKLKMSQAIAGVTLLAFANGATDVIAGIVAGGKESGGVQIAIGALFGACLFTITCVLARCIQGAEAIQTEYKSVGRDLLFLLIATVYFVFLAVIDMITPFLAAGFFLLYLVYFAVVLYQEKMNNEPKIEIKEQLLEINQAVQKRSLLRSMTAGHEHMSLDELGSQVTRRSMKRLLSRKMSLQPSSCHSFDDTKRDSAKTMTEEKEDHVVVLDENRIETDIEDEEDDTVFGRMMIFYNAPFIFIRELTMPPFEEERWNLYKTGFTPFFGLLFAIWQLGLLEYFDRNRQLWIVYFGVALVLSLWIFITGLNKNLAEVHAGKFAFVSFIISCLWLSFFANCFMDFLSLITVISGLPLNYLSLTMLAWGNSLDDFFIDYFIAKSGHGAMAVTGVFAGQLFNLLIGFGGAMFLQSLNGTIYPNIFLFDAADSLANILTLTLLGSLIACLVLTMLFSKLNKWVMSKKIMIFLLTFYISFFVVVTVISLVL